MSVPLTTPRSGPPTPLAAAPAQRVLAVEFRSLDGRRWSSTGRGAAVAAATVDGLAGFTSSKVS